MFDIIKAHLIKKENNEKNRFSYDCCRAMFCKNIISLLIIIKIFQKAKNTKNKKCDIVAHSS